ncbi:ABC transporter permease [Rhodococcus rhodochrous]|uniref:ABC transporter permease n=1 Tax=Rhodococcus rhodochrous TaxID=1829 RepID=UPI001E3A7495|nr:ABC transporter permease [Rhodococcus rhodochrous]MCD2100229.1 ABC transporter permease [Rhodococcus rhodochrous]MCD2124569.1 ABC transporter permease [Rhodococcus rhodochrous]MCQ4137601.1 ABC transporter permease [Rhodococcus rhodochrous]MDJ0021383.1 ABC transporter permease [Rhodococcus rhodochrous]
MTRGPVDNGALRDWLRFFGRRLLQGLFVLWAAFTLVFVVLYLLPSDPIQLMLSGSGAEFASADDATIAQLRAQYGMDKPAFLQYLDALWNALHGDFGMSIQTGRPVADLITEALSQTVVLGLFALAIGLILGFVLAIAATLVRFGWLQQLLLSLPAAGVSVPSFWVGLLLIQYFAFDLGWFPPLGGKGINGLVLPAVTLSIPTAAFVAQILAKSLSVTMHEPYIEVVRSKGASRAHALFHDALRNASLPLLTMVGMIVGNILAGSVVVETVFSRMGLGRITYEAVNAQDIPVVLGVVTFAATVFVVLGIIVDLLYPLLDPRIGSQVRTRRRPRLERTPERIAS